MRIILFFLLVLPFAIAQDDLDAELRALDAQIAAKEAEIENLSKELERAESFALATEPAQLEFETERGSKDFFVFDGADIVPSSAIKSVVIAGKSYVQQMFTVERGSNGYNGITIATVPGKVEAGTYRVEVTTTSGKATLDIATTFGPKQPKTNTGARDSFDIILPAQFPMGAYVDLSTYGDIAQHYTWKVDGKVVSEGPDKSKLRYILTKAGPISISVDQRFDDGSGHNWTGTTTVVREKSQSHSMKKGQEFAIDATFLGLTDFSQHTWFLDGKNIGTSPQFKMKFPNPGNYAVTCRATKPTNANSKFGMREVTYRVTVQ